MALFQTLCRDVYYSVYDCTRDERVNKKKKKKEVAATLICLLFQGPVRFYDNERKAYILLKQFQSKCLSDLFQNRYTRDGSINPVNHFPGEYRAALV